MRSTSLTLYQFQLHNVRVVVIDGEPWFVGKDVCAALEHSNHRQALKRLPDTVKKGVTIDYPLGGPQETTAVSLPGILQLIATSRSPRAKPFQAWMFQEVMPSVVKQGAYVAPGAQLTKEQMQTGSAAKGREARLQQEADRRASRQRSLALKKLSVMMRADGFPEPTVRLVEYHAHEEAYGDSLGLRLEDLGDIFEGWRPGMPVPRGDAVLPVPPKQQAAVALAPVPPRTGAAESPPVGRKSPTEMGEMFGVTPSMVGHVLKALGLRHKLSESVPRRVQAKNGTWREQYFYTLRAVYRVGEELVRRGKMAPEVLQEHYPQKPRAW